MRLSVTIAANRRAVELSSPTRPAFPSQDRAGLVGPKQRDNLIPFVMGATFEMEGRAPSRPVRRSDLPKRARASSEVLKRKNAKTRRREEAKIRSGSPLREQREDRRPIWSARGLTPHFQGRLDGTDLDQANESSLVARKRCRDHRTPYRAQNFKPEDTRDRPSIRIR